MKTSKMWILMAALASLAAPAMAMAKDGKQADQELGKLIEQSARDSKDCKKGHRHLALEGTDVFPANSVYQDEAQVKSILDRVEAFGREQPASLRELGAKLTAVDASGLKPEKIAEGINEMQRCPRLSHFSVISNLVRSAGKLKLKPETRERVGRATLDFISGQSFPAFLPVETLWQAVLLDMMLDNDLLQVDGPQREKIKALVHDAKMAQARAARRAEESKTPSERSAGELFLKQTDDLREVRANLMALVPQLKIAAKTASAKK